MADGSQQPENTQVEMKRLQNEALRIKLNFWKFILGTVAVALLTLLINWTIQNKRLEYELLAGENKFIGQFVQQALDRDLEKRRDFAEYFLRLTPSVDSKVRWGEYRDYTAGKIVEAEAKEKEIEQKEVLLASVADEAVKLNLDKYQAEKEAMAAEKALKAKESKAERIKLEKANEALMDANNKAAQLEQKVARLQSEVAGSRRDLAVIRSRSDLNQPFPANPAAPRLEAFAYYGIQTGESEWGTRYFRRENGNPLALPKQGDIVVAIGNVNARAGYIEYKPGSGWTNKPAIGLIRVGDRLRVIKSKSVAGGFIWIKFRRV